MSKKRNFSQTRQELLNNTVTYYSEDPVGRRALTATGGCAYLTKCGKMCAIGRELLKPSSLSNIAISDNIDYIPKRLQKMGEWFLDSIQTLHDTNSYWDTNGLTNQGKEHVAFICKEYTLINPLT